MQLRTIRIIHFRNHAETTIECGSRLNVFTGQNGAGKTNILDAISYACLTKSFFGHKDTAAVQVGQDGFSMNADLESDAGVGHRVALTYDVGSAQKRVLLDRENAPSVSAMVGMFPVVVLAPENREITTGSPAERRRFMDIVLSQASRPYLEDILEYRRVLRQRNRILGEHRAARTQPGTLLDPWNSALVEWGSRIIRRRSQFVDEFQPHLAGAFDTLTARAEEPSIRYRPLEHESMPQPREAVEEMLRAELRRLEFSELRYGTSLAGPHRDELALAINGMDVRRFASQGQHKTWLIALKLAEFSYLRDRRKETPLLLLDDVFSELDAMRSEKLFDVVLSTGQTFVTTTDEERAGRIMSGNGTKSFFVEAGHVAPLETRIGVR